MKFPFGWIKPALALGLMLVLTGCTGISEKKAEVKAVVHSHIADALKLADDDIIAATCYRAILARGVDQEASPDVDMSPVVLFQKARNARRRLDDGVDETLKVACAALFIDIIKVPFRVRRLLSGL